MIYLTTSRKKVTQKIRNEQQEEQTQKYKHEERKSKKSILQREKEIDWEDELKTYLESPVEDDTATE